MKNTTNQKTIPKEKKSTKTIDSISGVASKLAIANEYDK
jgi:hypothetical protein